MAWGFFKKIKQGIKKAGKWIKDKVINPIVKPVVNVAKKIMPMAEPIADTFIPGSGRVISKGVDFADDIINRRIRLK